MRRTQIYLDERQSLELGRRAAARGTTTSKVIREAIDEYLADAENADEPVRRFRAGLDLAFGVAPGLDPGADHVEALRRADAERDDDLREAGGR